MEKKVTIRMSPEFACVLAEAISTAAGSEDHPFGYMVSKLFELASERGRLNLPEDFVPDDHAFSWGIHGQYTRLRELWKKWLFYRLESDVVHSTSALLSAP